MSAELSLEQVFAGEEFPEEAAEEVAETEDTATGEAEPEAIEAEGDAQEEADEAEGSTPEPEQEAEPESVPVAAVAAVRRQKQEWQRKAEEAEQRLKQYEEQQRQKPDEPLPDVFADQEGFAQRIKGDFSREMQAMRIEMSRELMSSAHEDYEAREAKFLEYAQKNPAVLERDEFRSNPAKFAYEFAGKLDEVDVVLNADQAKARMREELRKELRAELEKEQQSQQEEQSARRDAAMPTLASSGSSGPGAEAEPALSDLLPLG